MTIEIGWLGLVVFVGLIMGFVAKKAVKFAIIIGVLGFTVLFILGGQFDIIQNILNGMLNIPIVSYGDSVVSFGIELLSGIMTATFTIAFAIGFYYG